MGLLGKGKKFGTKYTSLVKFISAKNIIIFFVSSDDFTCLICGWKNSKYGLQSIYVYEKKLYWFKFSGERKGGLIDKVLEKWRNQEKGVRTITRYY